MNIDTKDKQIIINLGENEEIGEVNFKERDFGSKSISLWIKIKVND